MGRPGPNWRLVGASLRARSRTPGALFSTAGRDGSTSKMLRITVMVAGFGAAFLPGAQVAAQSLRPLLEVAPQAEASYPLVRCAGLYWALKEWTGTNVLGPKAFAAYDDNIRNLMYFATLIRVGNTGGAFDAVSTNVARDTNNIVKLYLARIKANYAATGQGFGDDFLIRDDLELCTKIAETAAQRMQRR
jgi:hypothetical protein